MLLSEDADNDECQAMPIDHSAFWSDKLIFPIPDWAYDAVDRIDPDSLQFFAKSNI